MPVKYTTKFEKQYKKAGKNIQEAFDHRLTLFLIDSFHPLLNNHILTGKYSGWRSIDITGDWRAHYAKTTDAEGRTIIIFGRMGTHSQLYR